MRENKTTLDERLNCRCLMVGLSFCLIMVGFTARAESSIPRSVSAILAGLSSINQMMFMLAFTDDSAGTLKYIRADLDQDLGKRPFPKLGLRKNEVTVNGELTGVKIISLIPITLKYKGKTWVYAKSKGLEENYKSLRGLLDQRHAFSSFWINSANALTNEFFHNAIGGSLVLGGVVSALMCVAAEPCGIFAVLAPIGLGAGAEAFNATKRPTVEIKCYSDSTPPFIWVNSNVEGQIKLFKSNSGRGYTSLVYNGKNVWKEGSDVVDHDPDGFDELAKLIGSNDVECGKAEASINRKLAQAYEKIMPPLDPVGGTDVRDGPGTH